MRIISLSLLTVGMLWLLCGCGRPAPPPPAPPPPTTVAPADPTAAPAADHKLGQQIFETGIGASGAHVAFTAGADAFRAQPSGCAACHGTDGTGKAVGTMRTPNITYAELRRGDKPDFSTDEALLTAVRTGQEEDGEKLSAVMPRWQLSDEEGRALLEHLKMLKPVTRAAPAAEAK